ncbi:MAG TPA: hypothetical protein VKD90_27990 [Gemmataceae bacterium]|nr:hypothetical protein [Gemmataceae bacterium]
MTRLSFILGLIALAAVLVIGVPLFLRTPVWVDVTYHDVSAWNVLHGGVHYRDVFETNLPGMVWLHCAVRPVVGWSHEAIRTVDLLVFGSVLFLLMQMMKRSGIGAGGRVWFVVAAALFYLFETEFIHCQRDGWMLLPVVAATVLRVRRCARMQAGIVPPRPVWTLAEGFLWGFAVWIKPHVLVPVLFVWLISLRFQGKRNAIGDTVALLAGGLLAGSAGALWLIQTGAWSPMWDVLRNWNPEYYKWSWADAGYKVRLVSAYFAPFSLLHFAAVPVALIAVVRRDPSRAILAVLYLGWLAQATLIQKPLDYAHAPPTLLGLAVLAIHRWPVGPIFLAWCVAAGLVHEFDGESRTMADLRRAYPITVKAVIPHHPIARSDRLALWGRCWHDDSWELKDRLTYYPDIHCAPHWADLARVADFLRSKDVGDRDVICWHDSTHPLYVQLGIRPGLRFPHVITAMKFRSKLDVIRDEAFQSPARYVVSDLVPVSYLHPFGPYPPPGPTTELPRDFPAWGPNVYPWNQPVVFRAGRYIVHEVRNPHGEIDFPFPKVLWD